MQLGHVGIIANEPRHFYHVHPHEMTTKPHCVPPTASCWVSDGLRHIAKVWASYLQRTAAAAVAAAGGGGGEEGTSPLHPPLALGFGPATEPGPLDTTGRLPNELLESMFDYLDEDMTMNCASVARRYIRSG